MTDALLAELRSPTFAIAYRMLGSVSEAEDVVQETLLRVHRAVEAGEDVASPRAYAATIATRLSIDQLRSARAGREQYVGDWLPEPLVGDEPAEAAEMADSLSLAFLVLLESLSPEQRAVLLLRDAFDYGYDEIAEIVGKNEANVRQLATRSRRHVDERRPRFEASRERRDELARRFCAAAQQGDLGALEELLAADVVLQGDGGGKAPALARALHGRERVARTFNAWAKAGLGLTTMRPAEVNGQPGVIIEDDEGQVYGVMALDIADGQVQGIKSVVNPDKLGHVGRVGDAQAFLARRRERGNR